MGHQGLWFNPEIETYYNRARTFCAKVGRWLMRGGDAQRSGVNRTDVNADRVPDGADIADADSANAGQIAGDDAPDTVTFEPEVGRAGVNRADDGGRAANGDGRDADGANAGRIASDDAADAESKYTGTNDRRTGPDNQRAIADGRDTD
jgi:hypothetical protein